MTKPTREELLCEINNIESCLSQMLPREYLESIGASAEAPDGYERDLSLRCLRVFDDLAMRLAAPPAAAPPAAPPDPPGLVAVVKAAQDAALAYNQIVFGDSALSRAAQARRDAINAVLDYNLSAPPAEQDARARAMEGR